MFGKLSPAAKQGLRKESKSFGRQKPHSKKVTGTVRVVGNEPSFRTVVTVFSDGIPADCLIEGPLERRLRDGHPRLRC